MDHYGLKGKDLRELMDDQVRAELEEDMTWDLMQEINRKLDILLARTAPKVKAVKPTKFDYDDFFNKVWESYPKRLGNNPKVMAYRAYNARRAENISPEVLAAGVRRYKAFCDATGKTGTEFVMQASTFFGPRYEFEEEWKLPTVENIQPRTNEEWMKKGVSIGVEPRTSESWADYIQRVKGAMQ
jgi:hypothetical protein